MLVGVGDNCFQDEKQFREDGMGIFAGIDEAGFGPILGPLVVSSVVFSVPDEVLTSDMWEVLARAVGRKKARLCGRLLITDSKKAYSRTAGIGHLRRTVLAAVGAMQGDDNKGPLPGTAGELLDVLCPGWAERLLEYPWYQNIKDHPLGSDSDDIQIASSVLKNTLIANGIRLTGMSTQCLDVAHYNRMCSVVKNKSLVLFTAVSKLITDIFEGAYDGEGAGGPGNIQIIIDRQGGRTRYRNLLGRMFPELEMRILKETETLSSYELSGKGRCMRLHFAVKGDLRFLPVALGSMVSKLVREILVEQINRYFLKYSPEIRPTAGYFKDGRRFIKDVESNPKSPDYESFRLIRSR